MSKNPLCARCKTNPKRVGAYCSNKCRIGTKTGPRIARDKWIIMVEQMRALTLRVKELEKWQSQIKQAGIEI